MSIRWTHLHWSPRLVGGTIDRFDGGSNGHSPLALAAELREIEHALKIQKGDVTPPHPLQLIPPHDEETFVCHIGFVLFGQTLQCANEGLQDGFQQTQPLPRPVSWCKVSRSSAFSSSSVFPMCTRWSVLNALGGIRLNMSRKTTVTSPRVSEGFMDLGVAWRVRVLVVWDSNDSLSSS